MENISTLYDYGIYCCIDEKNSNNKTEKNLEILFSSFWVHLEELQITDALKYNF